jgi:hypothetical protein
MTDVYVPPRDDTEFENQVDITTAANTRTELREEIDAIIGLGSPSWKETSAQSSHFNKEEMALLLLALGGPQGVSE